MVAAASPPPAPAPLPHAAPGRAHPTYTKMIKHALTELGGCSARSGIARYILDRFSGFPAFHDALLSAHLRRLLAEGVLRTHGEDYTFAPPEERRGPGRPRKDPTPAVPEKRRGPGRPRKSPQASSDAPLQPGRPTAQGTTAEAFQNGGVQSGGASSSTGAKRGRGRPRKQNTSAAPAAAMSPSSTKRGRGRPRKHKPPEAAASSPTTASRGFKRGCGRPSMDRASAPAVSAEATMDKAPSAATTVVSAEASIDKLAATAAAMYAETGDAAASTGGGQSRMENLAAAVAAMSREGTKRGRGRPRKEKPAPVAGAGVKRSRGRPGKDRSVRPRLVESPYEAFFRDMMAETSDTLEEEDSVSGEKTTQADNGVAPREGNGTRAAADAAGRVPVSGENAMGAPAPADVTDPDLDPANLADDTVSTGIKRPRGRPRKNKPSAAADDGVSTGVKRGRGRPRTEKLEDAMSAETGDAAQPAVVKKARGRPRKERLQEGISAETGDVVPPTVVKRGRGRPRKKKRAADVKTGGGRPRKEQHSGTGLAEAAGEALFRDMAETPGNFVSSEKTD